MGYPRSLGCLPRCKACSFMTTTLAAAFPRSSGIPTQPSGATLAARTATIAHYRHWSANLLCVPNKWCRKLKRLKQAKKHVKKREGNEEKWEKKCSPSPPIDF